MIINEINIKIKNGAKISFRSPHVGEGKNLLIYFKCLLHQSSRFLNFPPDHYDTKSSTQQEDFIKQFAEDKHSIAIFAYFEENPIGHIIIHNLGFERAHHRAQVMMGVIEEWQNNGIGHYLLDLAIEESLKIGVFSLELRVRDFNSNAIHLYVKHGFKLVGCIQGAVKIDNEFCNEYILLRNDKIIENKLKPPINLKCEIVFRMVEMALLI